MKLKIFLFLFLFINSFLMSQNIPIPSNKIHLAEPADGQGKPFSVMAIYNPADGEYYYWNESFVPTTSTIIPKNKIHPKLPGDGKGNTFAIMAIYNPTTGRYYYWDGNAGSGGGSSGYVNPDVGDSIIVKSSDGIGMMTIYATTDTTFIKSNKPLVLQNLFLLAETAKTDITNFNNNLSASDTDVQTALETLDDIVIPAASTDDQTAAEVPTNVTNFDNNLSSADTDVQKALETLDEVVGGAAGALPKYYKLTSSFEGSGAITGMSFTATAGKIYFIQLYLSTNTDPSVVLYLDLITPSDAKLNGNVATLPMNFLEVKVEVQHNTSYALFNLDGGTDHIALLRASNYGQLLINGGILVSITTGGTVGLSFSGSKVMYTGSLMVVQEVE